MEACQEELPLVASLVACLVVACQADALAAFQAAAQEVAPPAVNPGEEPQAVAQKMPHFARTFVVPQKQPCRLASFVQHPVRQRHAPDRKALAVRWSAPEQRLGLLP